MLAFAAVSSLSLVTHRATRHGRPGLHSCNSGMPLTAITQRDPRASHPAPHSVRIVASCETATVLPGGSAVGAPIRHGRLAAGHHGTRPGGSVFTVVRSTKEEPGCVPAASPRVRRRPSPWPPGRLRNTGQGVPRPDRRVRTAPGPDPPGFEPVSSLRDVKTPIPRVLLSLSLAGPAPSGSTDPSRLCQGCSRPPRHHPDQAALSYADLLRQARRRRSLTSTRTTAPHGATRSRARRPGPPSFYDGPGLLPPPGDLILVPLGGAAGRDLHAPADPVQQHIHPGRRVLHPKPLPDLLGDPGQRPALIRKPAGGQACVQHRRQLALLSRAELALRAARALGGQRHPAARGQRPPPPVWPTSATPENASPPPGRQRRPRSSPLRPAAPAPGGHAPPRSARRHRDTSCLRHSALRAG
jgi:hypothetical protein